MGTDGRRRSWPSSASASFGRKASRAGFSSTPLPRVLTTETVPRRQASTSPGTPEVGVRAQLERVAEPGVDPPQDDVDRLQAAEGPHPEPAVAHGEVVAFDQRVAEVGGQKGVLEGGLARASPGVRTTTRGSVAVGGATATRPARRARKNGASRCTWASRYRLGKTREITTRFSRA